MAIEETVTTTETVTETEELDSSEGVPASVGTVPVVPLAAATRPEGQLVPGEPGAPPVKPWQDSTPEPIKEVPFASPPPPQPGVPAGVSVHPDAPTVLIPVAPGTVLPDGAVAVVSGGTADPATAHLATPTVKVPAQVPTSPTGSGVLTTGGPQPIATPDGTQPGAPTPAAPTQETPAP